MVFLFTLAQRTEDDGVVIHSRTKDRGEAETGWRGPNIVFAGRGAAVPSSHLYQPP